MTKKSRFTGLFIAAALAALVVLWGHAIEVQAAGPAPGQYLANGSFSNPSFGMYMLAGGAGSGMGGGMGSRGAGMGGASGMGSGYGMGGGVGSR